MPFNKKNPKDEKSFRYKIHFFLLWKDLKIQFVQDYLSKDLSYQPIIALGVDRKMF